MDETPEWRAMSPEMRRQSRWFHGNDIPRLVDTLRARFGDRLSGAPVKGSGDGYVVVLPVRDLTDDERTTALTALGEGARQVELRSTPYSFADLRRVQRQVIEFVRARPDGAAQSASSIRPDHVRVWVRPEAPGLAQALLDRFGDAVHIEWGASYHRQDTPGPAGEPPRIAP